jgi:hypothetical protein
MITNDDQLSREQLAELVMLPHWLLKFLYSRVGIMFANFWRGYATGVRRTRYSRYFAAAKNIFSDPALPQRDSCFLTADAN